MQEATHTATLRPAQTTSLHMRAGANWVNGTRAVESPEPAAIAPIAKALDVDVHHVALSVAVSIGLPVKANGSDLAAMLPFSAHYLTAEQRDVILAVVKAMNPPAEWATEPPAPAPAPSPNPPAVAPEQRFPASSSAAS